MREDQQSSVSQRIARLRWQTPILAFLLVLAHQLIEHTWLIHLPPWQHFASQMLFYGMVGPALAIWVLTSLRKSALETEEAESAVRRAHTQLEKSNQRLEFLVRVSRRLSEVQDEDSLAEVILDLPLTVVPAVGSSLIQYDEHEQPRFALHRGDLDPDEFKRWANHLSQMRSSQVCQHCSTHWASDSSSCPLVDPLSREYPVKKVYCLELKRRGRQFGVLNIYLSDTDCPTPGEDELLTTMGIEMSLALESMHLRSKEIDAMYRLQQSSRLVDFQDDMGDALFQIVDALEVDGALLFIKEVETENFRVVTEAGLPLNVGENLVKALAKSALESKIPFLINSLDQINLEERELKSLLVAPLHSDQGFLGSLVIWSIRKNAFSQRHIRLITSLAGQISLLIENHRLYLQAEHQAALMERARLVREIHDGLSQSLGYMQLRIAQINRWMESGRVKDVVPALLELERELDEAYIDAREAIDGLRLKPGEDSFDQLLKKVFSDFEEAAEITLIAAEPPAVDLGPSVQDHVLRILQEALGNVRKHSRASNAWIDWCQDDGWIVLSVKDDGQGFSLKDVPSISHYGLRVMQERAELLGGVFQVNSEPGNGTEAVLRFPVKKHSSELM